MKTTVALVKSDVAAGATNTLRPLTHPSGMSRTGGLAVDATPIDPASIAKDYWRACDQCGTEFRVRACYARKAIRRGHNPPRFCSRKCQLETYKGAGNPKWRGGRVISASGYVHVLVPDHPHADHHGYYEEHRLVMERHLGRILEPTECVHHFNHNRTDNRIENLELMQSWSEHQRRHGYYEPRECGTCGKVIMRSRAARRRFPKRSFCSRQCAAAAASRANAEAARSGKRPLPTRMQRKST